MHCEESPRPNWEEENWRWEIQASRDTAGTGIIALFIKSYPTPGGGDRVTIL